MSIISRKVITFLALLSIVTQSLSPVLALTPQAFAQETPVEESTVTPPAEETQTPPAEQQAPQEEVTPEPTVEVTPTVEETPTTPTEQPAENQENNNSPNPNSTETATPTVTNLESPTPTPSNPEENTEELNVVVLENVSAPSIDLEAVEESGSASLTTDKTDYAPTDTALISGHNLTPSTNYTLLISSQDEPAVSHEAQVSSDENGVFAYAYQLDGIYRPNYKAELRDSSGSIVATVYFTDARTVNSATLNGSSSGVTVAAGSTITVVMNVSTTGSGEDNDWDSTSWQIGSVQASPNLPNCINTPDHSGASTYNETFNITAPATSGVYHVFLKAHNNGNTCSTSGQSPTLTLLNSVTVLTTIPFTETFGSTNSSNTPAWAINESEEVISGSGDDSPVDGKFAKIGNNGWICRTFNTTGTPSLQLSYAWKGDEPSENNDFGIVEYKVGGTCTSSGSWINLTSNQLDDTSWGNNSHSLPGNNTLNIRFRTDASQSDEFFRVDNISLSSLSLPDLTVTKTNNVNGSVVFGNTFTWTITVTNSGVGAAVFGDDENIFEDNLPSNADYSPSSNIPVTTSPGITGTIDCDIDNDDENLVCDANGAVTIPAGGSFSFTFTVDPDSAGTFENPRDNGNCEVDPDSDVNETNNNNNSCSDTVTVTNIQAVANPLLGQSCGLDIALVIDNSGSINDTELATMKTAFQAFVNAFLPGTPTQFSLTRFNTTASVVQGFTGTQATINGAISGISTSGGFTNWEDGLLKAQGTFDPRPGTHANLVLFASDGQPNTIGNGPGNNASPDGSSTAMNPAITVANSLKTDGTRVVALGIGITGNGLDNLKEISGPNVGTSVNSDVITSSFDTLAADLAEYANELCGGTITVNKEVDADGDGVYEGGNTEANVLGFDWGIDQEVPGRDMGTNLSDVASGSHSITENTISGYQFTGWYSANSNFSCQEPEGTTLPVDVNVSDNTITSITLCNAVNDGSVVVIKYFDKNYDGNQDPGEESLSGWTINLDQFAPQVTDANGQVIFSNIPAGFYTLSENIKDGWEQTNISCSNDQRETNPIPSDLLDLPEQIVINQLDNDNSHQVQVTPNGEITCWIGNFTETVLSISKSNDTGGLDEVPGGTVLFTLTVTASQSAANNVSVKDLLPDGFTYNSGSWTATSSVFGPIAITEPVYASPGTWNLGNMQEGETITLTYTANISGSQDAGLYKDLAWAKGNALNGDTVLALAEPTGFVDTNFVGTDVNVVASTQGTAGITVKKIQDVLGAATSILPETGMDYKWLLLVGSILSAGFAVLLYGMQLRRKNA